MECACIDVDIDLDCTVEILSDKTVMAKKEHKCCECKRAIEPGEKYRNECLKFEGKLERWKTCLDCLSVRREIFCSFYFGCLWDDLETELFENDGTLSEECVSSLTCKARERVCEIIDRVWEKISIEEAKCADLIGKKVKVKADQPNRLGKAKYPGRLGVVTKKNGCGGSDRGGLWYVRLESTAKGAQRLEHFWGDELEVLDA